MSYVDPIFGEVEEIIEPDFLLEFANNGTKINPDSINYPKLKEDGYATGDYPKSEELNGYLNNYSNWLKYLKFLVHGNVSQQIETEISNILGLEISGANYAISNPGTIDYINPGKMSLIEPGSKEKIFFETNNGYSLKLYDNVTNSWIDYDHGGIMATGLASPTVGTNIFVFYIVFGDTEVFGADTARNGINIVQTIRTSEGWADKMYIRRIVMNCIDYNNSLVYCTSKENKIFLTYPPESTFFATLNNGDGTSFDSKNYIPSVADGYGFHMSFKRRNTTPVEGYNIVDVNNNVRLSDGAFEQINYSSFQIDLLENIVTITNEGDDLENGIIQPLYYIDNRVDL